MVAVKGHEADRFIARPPANVFIYLVFGTDPGLVTERARKIISQAVADPKDPFQLVRIAGDELAADPLRLADEANTIPLLGGSRAIWIETQGKAFTAAIEPLLRLPPRDSTIVIEAGALKKDAPLRSLCERAKCAAAIQCYPDTSKDVAQLIEAEAAAAGLRIAPDAKAFLISLLGEDRLSTRLELEKLMLYAHGAGEITLDHVAAIVCDASRLAASEAVDSAFSGDLAALDTCLSHVFAGASDYHAVLAAALRHALDLHRARHEAGEGSEDSRDGSGYAGFRRGQAFDQHLRAWTRAGLGRAVGITAEAIALARREPKLGPSLAARALWSIANSARGKAGRA
jgi:DNA polymerase-3 subunit delta